MLDFDDATDDDAAAITTLHAAAAADLTARFGEGHWSRPAVVRRIDARPGRVRVRVGRDQGEVVTVLRLQTKKPWAIDATYFTPVDRTLYLMGLVVSAAQHGRGRGRAALEDARRVAESWPADAIRLDAYDSDAGAGAFYVKCGYTERGRVRYRGNPLVYYELLLPRDQR
jgi:ribosomal protein S18 acetylase RimI-like enzyme